MGWWFTSSDKDDNENEQHQNQNNFFSNFSSNVSSVSRVCRPDPQDQNYMVCKIKETKTQKVNGENVTNTEEREERIPTNNQISPFDRQNMPAFPQRFEQNEGFGPEFEHEMSRVQDFLSNPFGTFFNATGMPFGEIIREMDRMVGGFHDFEQYNQEAANSQYVNNPFYQNIPQNPNFPAQQQQQQQNYGYPKSQYDYNFQKTPRSDKDIYDV